jgi:hypothetical protein
VLLSMPGVCRAGTPYLVGSVAAATNALLVEGVGIYHFSTGEIPTLVLAADAPERYVYFGVPVPLTFNNAVPGASYQVVAVFSSDNTRVQTLSLNGTQLGSSFTLPAQSWTNLSWYCGVASSSTLAFVLEKTTGPNAVVSSVKIYSSDPTLLTPPPIDIAFTIPRLSPLPATVAGVSSPRLDLGGTWQFRTAASAGFPSRVERKATE